MIFRDDIDGRTLTVTVSSYEGKEFVAISMLMVTLEGEGCFSPKRARQIAQNIIEQADIIEKGKKCQ